MAWLYLTLAALFEITFAISMKASDGFTKLGPSMATLIGIAGGIFFLTLALKHLPVSIGYPRKSVTRFRRGTARPQALQSWDSAMRTNASTAGENRRPATVTSSICRVMRGSAMSRIGRSGCKDMCSGRNVDPMPPRIMLWIQSSRSLA